ncbi:MAG: O-antigen ligase family protein [Gemmatimonadaceae bacterium]|nr:O-antigen ligase family protein [Acetobacteraceae bacterium]
MTANARFLPRPDGPAGGEAPPLPRSGLRSRQAPPQSRGDTRTVYALLAALLLAVGVLGLVGGSVARFLFVIGSIAIAHRAYRVGGLPLHVEVVIVLFVFGPFLRRVIDLQAGYDPSATMLIGPLLALAVAFPGLQTLVSAHNRSMTAFIPYVIMAGCVVYGWAISAFEGNLLASSIVAVKYLIPLCYCMCLMLRPDQRDAVLEAAARAFLIVGPIIGLYGVLQHLSPMAWDQFWMVESKIPSIGMPFAGEVRVFSTMNSPASFAAYATCGLLLFSFTSRSLIPPVLVPAVAILPLCLAILLTSVRTAWIGAAVCLLFCLLFNKTRSRAILLIVCLAFGVAFAVLFTAFGDVIMARFATLDTNVAGDGSGGERMRDYFHVFGGDSRYIFGAGLSPLVGDAKMAALDGQLLMSAVQMGTTIGVLHVLCIIWAGAQALIGIKDEQSALRLIAAALIFSNLFILPLTAVATGEIGFLFWTMVGVMTVPRQAMLPVQRGPAYRARYGSVRQN